MQAALTIGRSFAELYVRKNGGAQFVKRIFLPSETIANSLKRSLEEIGPIESLTVSSRILEKIFSTKLGGSVAQVVSAGFESWTVIRQPIYPEHFELTPTRSEPLASQELIYGVNERVDAKGNIVKALDPTELQFISEKLKMVGTKRICVNFLHSSRNPVHQEQTVKYFSEQGFQVFSPLRPEASSDEVPAWRHNILNACLTGSFEELYSELKESTPVPVKFLNGFGESFDSNCDEIVSSLFAWAECLTRGLSANSEVLCLDLEQWSWLDTKKRAHNWESPWGRIEISHPLLKNFSVQPTNELITDFTGCFNFSLENQGYEPGPMSFGRGMKPLVFDALAAVVETGLAQVTKSGQQKYHDMVAAWVKHHPALSDLSVANINQKVLDSCIDQIGCEVTLVTQSKKILVTGFWAPFLFQKFVERFPHIEWKLDSEATQRMGISLFACASNSENCKDSKTKKSEVLKEVKAKSANGKNSPSKGGS